MANPDHLVELLRGASSWNQWREDWKDVQVDLSQADLSHADLTNVNLIRANIRGTNLNDADLRGAILEEADLTDSGLTYVNLTKVSLKNANLTRGNLYRANLYGANLYGANLRQADLSQADLSSAHLSGGHLDGANLSGAKLAWTILVEVDLSNVEGLLSIQHGGPSSIGIDTFYRSQGKIPDLFFRGCGVPDQFITYARSLIGQAIEFYSCFISYSSQDQAFAERLHADLQNKGVRCWFAPHDIQGGKKIHEQIDEAIRVYEKLLLVLSPSSISSEWVNTEISKARKKEIQHKTRMLFPVRLIGFETLRDWECFDADAGKDSAREIREYFIPDFSNWKDHDSYQKAFERLLRDLKSNP